MARPDRRPGQMRDGPAVALRPGHPPYDSTPPPQQQGSAAVSLSGPDGPESAAAGLSAQGWCQWRQRGAVDSGGNNLFAEWISLSDERDRWERFAVAWARSAYRDGYRDGLRAGRVDGYRLGYAAASADWWLAAGPAPRTGSHAAELDRLRYPPGGRQSWIATRPGEGRHRHG